MRPTVELKKALASAGAGGWDASMNSYDPDKEFRDIENTPVLNPVVDFNRQIEAGTARVVEAFLWKGKVDSRGKLIDKETMREADIPAAYLIEHVVGHEAFVAAKKKAEEVFKLQETRAQQGRDLNRRISEAVRLLKEDGLLEDNFATDPSNASLNATGGGNYDPNQYTEYTPTYGGPFFKQLYLTDYLTMHSRAFEQVNHHPIGKRIVDILAQYAFGRRFKVRIKDEKKEKAWNDFEKKINLTQRISKYWVREYVLYGELFIDKKTWQSIDPSTIWDVITDPDNILDVYYYYQSYTTAFQQFTGMKVKGAPGAENQKPVEYIIRQIPAQEVLHIKRNVVSQEKRGRSILFPVLGWLKRIKDLYNAEVISAWLQASFIWDDTIMGADTDVNAHAAKYAGMPAAGSVFVHNESVKRQPMSAMPSGGSRSVSGIGEELLSFIATGVGIPKDFFNVIGGGGGSRATALVGAEPFTKVIEDIEADIENLLLGIASEVVPDYQDGDVEFIFPSVTKDTTTETMKNIALGETLNWWSKETAAEMAAGEMNITTFNYDDEISKMQTAAKKPPLPPQGTPPPVGRFGSPTGNGTGDDGIDKSSPIHGTGKQRLKKQLGNL